MKIPRLTLFLNLLLVFVASFCSPLIASDSIRFIHIGDPQFGYGLDLKSGTAKRMRTLSDEINREQPAFVLIPGDLVEDRTLAQHWAFAKSIKNISVPLIMTAGNHDVVNLKDLKDYRKRYGQDYGITRFGWLTVLALNSEIMRDKSIDEDEYEKQWQWFEQQIEAHIKNPDSKKQLIITTHRPPFAYELDEPVSNVNWPPETRDKLLQLALDAGVKIIIVGHTHTTRKIAVPEADLTIYTVGGAARVFDDRGTGYRLFEVSPASYTQEYQQTATPPKTTSGLMGFNQWTPRIFDFSFRHWFWTLAFAGAALWLYLTAKQSRARAKRRNSSFGINWQRSLVVLAIWFGFFSINMQLDLDELFTEVARLIFTGSIRAYRQQIAFAFVIMVIVGLIPLVIWLIKGRDKHWPLLAVFLVLPSLTWFLLQIMSNHTIIILFPESIWDIIFLVSLALALGLPIIRRLAYQRPQQQK